MRSMAVMRGKVVTPARMIESTPNAKCQIIVSLGDIYCIKNAAGFVSLAFVIRNLILDLVEFFCVFKCVLADAGALEFGEACAAT